MSFIPEEGKIILIDKPLHWTSFDVVKKVRGLLNVKKVGHAGTLDPLATGLLIICAGKMTKQIQQFMDLEKEYTGTLVLGKTTPSIDLETAFDSEHPIDHLSQDMVLQVASRFTGNIMQTPPAFSAIKKDGAPIYLKARKGEKVQVTPRPVKIIRFEITGMQLPEIDFKLVCSKGFYVRSLVRDFGDALKVGAYLSSLRRTRIGHHTVEKALSIEAFAQSLENVKT